MTQGDGGIKMEKDNRINSISEFEEEIVDVVVVSSIDFEDPKSVVEYGKDKIEEISDILTNTALISSPVSELAIDTSEIEGLVKLDDSFQEIEQSLVKKTLFE